MRIQFLGMPIEIDDNFGAYELGQSRHCQCCCGLVIRPAQSYVHTYADAMLPHRVDHAPTSKWEARRWCLFLSREMKNRLQELGLTLFTCVAVWGSAATENLRRFHTLRNTLPVAGPNNHVEHPSVGGSRGVSLCYHYSQPS